MIYSRSKRDELETALSLIPKLSFLHLPTPLQKLDKISGKYGCDIFVKRDDLTGLALGGNKSRRYEYLFSYLQEQGYDSILHCVGDLSNDTAQIACAANKSNLELHLIVRTENPNFINNYGNIVLSRLAGCKLYIVPPYYSKDFFYVLKEHLGRDKKLFPIEAGVKHYSIEAHSIYGCLSYAACFLEILDQTSEMGIDTIVLESGGASQAGLLLAANYVGCKIDVVGNHPSDFLESEREVFVINLVKETSKLLCLDEPEINKVTQFKNIGAGYGITDTKNLETIKFLAQEEGLFLDPVYTSKSFSLIKQFDSKGLIYIHTGGIANIFTFPKEASQISKHELKLVQPPFRYRFNRFLKRLRIIK